MRTLLATVVMWTLLGATQASACPLGMRCLQAASASSPVETAAAQPAAAAHVDLAVARQPDEPDHMAIVAALGTRLNRPDPTALEMPWIWQILRAEVYDRLPRYAQDDRFSMVVSPVVVAGAFDTIPGVGLAGDF